jgi:outer membrane protein assembly factor BamB
MMRPLEPGDPRDVGEFRLRARLGAGGMGRVYLGYSPAGRAVAVKVCHPELAADPDFVARFAREVTTARAVNGLYTAPVIAAGPDDSPPWLATGYVPGPSLQTAVTGDEPAAGNEPAAGDRPGTGLGPLPAPTVWRLAAGLAEALRAVHASGLVHRDLKPSNVLLAADGPRVIDFGIARALDATSLTAAGYVLGTPAYMAPEQASAQPVSPASDVFSFGSVLCFAATGSAPFGDGEPTTVLYRIVNAVPELGGATGELRDLIAGCLAKDPAGRPTLAEVLRTCQAQIPRAAGSSASFWSGEVAALIAGYRAAPGPPVPGREPAPGPGREPAPGPGREPAPGPGREPAPAPGREPAPAPDGEDTRTGLVTPAAAGPGVADLAVPDPGAGSVSRRRAVGVTVAGLAAVGLAAGGWAFARSGSGSGSGRLPSGPGRRLWAAETGGPVTSGAVLSRGILYIGSDDGKVHAFTAASGKPAGTFPTAGAVSGGVSVAGSTLLAGSDDHYVHAFRLSPGGVAWTYRTGGPVRCQPVVVGGIVYVGSDDHYVYAIHAATGELAWRYPTGGPVRLAPLSGAPSYKNYLFVASQDGHVYALNPGTGKLWWKFAAAGQVTALAYGPGIAYACDSEGNLFALPGVGPPPGWTGNYGVVSGTPAIVGNIVYFGSAAAKVYAVNVYGGALSIWSYSTAGKVNSGLAADSTTAYAGDDDGHLYAIDTSSVSLRWRYQVGAAIQSPILLADGVVYFGSQDRHVYALRA